MFSDFAQNLGGVAAAACGGGNDLGYLAKKVAYTNVLVAPCTAPFLYCQKSYSNYNMHLNTKKVRFD